MKNEFHHRLIAIDKGKLKNFLNTLKEPCYESVLLKLVFPNIDILRSRPIDLYQYHFLLFHILYQLQEEYYQENKYLFIHFMRTVLVDYPEKGKCRFFEEQTCQFCKVSCESNKLYCAFHNDRMGESELEHLSMKYFYLDPSNYENLDEKTAEAFINGAWDLLKNYKTYQRCFSILDLPETWDIEEIRRKFKILAKQYHPDMGKNSHDKFIEINNAYRLLLRLIPLV